MFNSHNPMPPVYVKGVIFDGRQSQVEVARQTDRKQRDFVFNNQMRRNSTPESGGQTHQHTHCRRTVRRAEDKATLRPRERRGTRQAGRSGQSGSAVEKKLARFLARSGPISWTSESETALIHLRTKTGGADESLS